MASLKELQQALAARLTMQDGSLTTHDVQQPSPSPIERQDDLLREFDARELQQSRETLIRKRLSQIASLLPRTMQELGTNYGPLCRDFIDQHHFQGFQAPQLDAIHFARWLASQREISTISRWQLELAAWEALRVEWYMRSFLIRLQRFHYKFNVESKGASDRSGIRTLWIAVRLGRWGFLRPIV